MSLTKSTRVVSLTLCLQKHPPLLLSRWLNHGVMVPFSSSGQIQRGKEGENPRPRSVHAPQLHLLRPLPLPQSLPDWRTARASLVTWYGGRRGRRFGYHSSRDVRLSGLDGGGGDRQSRLRGGAGCLHYLPACVTWVNDVYCRVCQWRIIQSRESMTSIVVCVNNR